MELILEEKDFVNGKYSITYGGSREALFTIVDEPLLGINKITILVRDLLPDGTAGAASLQSAIIGFGNNIVGVKSSRKELRGKTFSRNNMAYCVVDLIEQ